MSSNVLTAEVVVSIIITVAFDSISISPSISHGYGCVESGSVPFVLPGCGHFTCTRMRLPKRSGVIRNALLMTVEVDLDLTNLVRIGFLIASAIGHPASDKTLVDRTN